MTAMDLLLRAQRFNGSAYAVALRAQVADFCGHDQPPVPARA
jgi:hypothetical protein